MKIVKAGYEITPNPIGDLGLMKKIELVARTCYKSEDYITDLSCIKMINNLIKRKHYAMLEHASLVFEVDSESYYDTIRLVKDLESLNFDPNLIGYDTFKSYLRFTEHGKCIISGNIRAWIEFLNQCVKTLGKIPLFLGEYLSYKKLENNPSDIISLFGDFLDVPSEDYIFKGKRDISCTRIFDLSSLSLEERLIHQDLTVKFIVDRAVANELVRHRDCSFAQESTRFCNYSKDKFGNEITVIEPCFWIKDRSEEDNTMHDYWVGVCEDSEAMYFQLLRNGATPQEARSVLPHSTKTEIFVTTNIREWIHILELRALGTTGKPHPQMEEVMKPLAKELANGLLSDFTYIDSVNKMLIL